MVIREAASQVISNVVKVRPRGGLGVPGMVSSGAIRFVTAETSVCSWPKKIGKVKK